jgi:hypothetical protein
MTKETKSVDIEVAKLAATVEKLKKDGWSVDGWDFSPKGPAFSVAKLSRDKVARKAPAKPKKK